ncbi:MAG: helix-turn-helix domain-containing protein [Deinococcus sp.]|nr:helix-turn-helix domain-containing protein [Deinococcus sp.]
MEALYHTVEEAAQLLGVEPGVLQEAISGGRLRASRRGKDYQIADNELDAYVARLAAPSKRRVGDKRSWRPSRPQAEAADPYRHPSHDLRDHGERRAPEERPEPVEDEEGGDK